MKKILTIAVLLISLAASAQFNDGNYKITTDYHKDLNSGEVIYHSGTSIILQSSLNKIIIKSPNGNLEYKIISKQVSHDGITTGDMEYTATRSNDGSVNTFIFKHRSKNSYSVNVSSLGGLWWEFHVTSITSY